MPRMAYFLKKSRNGKGLYLQIYESFYDPERGGTAHRSVRPIGYEHELREGGIADPVAHFRAEVARMNMERKAESAAESTRRITEETPERMLGYFPLKAVNEALGAGSDIDVLGLVGGFRFPLRELLSSLVYARAAAPCSKLRTFHDVLPLLAEPCAFSLDQLYDGLAFLGDEYEKVVEIYNDRLAALYARETSTLYFDCTNFYFEIDREDDLRRKGPSKEGRRDPIIGLGLLLDADCIPIGMRVFPGNESEKPVLREVIGSLKKRNGVDGRTVRVADKGLNCADNVGAAIMDGDGYIFSKSVKQLPAQELSWALGADGWLDVRDAQGALSHRLKSCVAEFAYSVTDAKGRKKKVEIEEKRVVTFNPKLARKQLSEIDRQVEKARGLRLASAKRSEYGDSARYVTFAAVGEDGCISDDAVVATLNHAAIEKARRLAGYNMLVTSEKDMADSAVYTTYHNLWRIEESFKVMKSQLDARPVYLQRESTITGHFLICYLAVLLLRVLQFKVLGGRFSSEDIMEMVRGLRVVKVSERRYVNLSKSSRLLKEMEKATGLPLNNYHLSKGQVSEILGWKLASLAEQKL